MVYIHHQTFINNSLIYNWAVSKNLLCLFSCILEKEDSEYHDTLFPHTYTYSFLMIIHHIKLRFIPLVFIYVINSQDTQLY